MWLGNAIWPARSNSAGMAYHLAASHDRVLVRPCPRSRVSLGDERAPRYGLIGKATQVEDWLEPWVV